MLASTVGMCIFLFRNLKSRIKCDFLLQVVANLMIVTSLLYYLYGSSSMVCLTRTLQLGAVSFQACGWIFTGMDPI